MIIKTTAYSTLVGGAGASQPAFDDAANDLNALHAINKIEFNSGWVVDGIRVTYSTELGLERVKVHGTFNEAHVRDKVVTIAADEYISAAMGLHGHPNGRYDYGDCIQKIRFRITNSKTGSERHTEYFGAAEQLQNPQEFKWEGRLSSFAGIADNSLSQVGLKGLKFGQITGKVVLAESIPYGGGRSPELMGQDSTFYAVGAELDFQKPIKSIEVWSGQVVDGLLVTYNLADGSTKDVMHGAGATERIVEVNGIYGVASPTTNWGTQIQLLTFKIHDSATGFYRHTASFGIPSQRDFVQETRKDLCVRGPLVGFAGVANNSANQGEKHRLVVLSQSANEWDL
ncbi:hypothetical protein AG1IA_08798 [Rhizoctonia solani AG-1 IA]|uniref:Jacalin-type lectin domain-containing protein n=1 Tax=Thanatephorus cucumeris (strain AG1-IA) TaxID=983506 RepID=L8WLE5_THACA|nr:hypothetical protein AG1IA_08798 [Rhizoctonia solani AG-1 IA]